MATSDLKKPAFTDLLIQASTTFKALATDGMRPEAKSSKSKVKERSKNSKNDKNMFLTGLTITAYHCKTPMKRIGFSRCGPEGRGFASRQTRIGLKCRKVKCWSTHDFFGPRDSSRTTAFGGSPVKARSNGFCRECLTSVTTSQ